MQELMKLALNLQQLQSPGRDAGLSEVKITNQTSSTSQTELIVDIDEDDAFDEDEELDPIRIVFKDNKNLMASVNDESLHLQQEYMQEVIKKVTGISRNYFNEFAKIASGDKSRLEIADKVLISALRDTKVATTTKPEVFEAFQSCLSVQASSASCERLFSIAGLETSNRLNSKSSVVANERILLRANRKFLPSISEMEDYFQNNLNNRELLNKPSHNYITSAGLSKSSSSSSCSSNDTSSEILQEESESLTDSFDWTENEFGYSVHEGETNSDIESFEDMMTNFFNEAGSDFE